MNTEEFSTLLNKARNGQATPEEKLEILKELNISAQELNQLLKDLLKVAKR